MPDRKSIEDRFENNPNHLADYIVAMESGYVG